MRGKALVVTDSDEHDEAGHMIEDAQIRTRMMLKRLKKMDGIKSELKAPRVLQKPNASITLVGWGSTYGAINEAVVILEKSGLAVNTLMLHEVWPFPVQAVTEALSKTGKNIAIENNATGQLDQLIREQTGIKVNGNILKFDGRPFSPDYIAGEVKKGVN